MTNLEKAKNNFLEKEKTYGEFATKSIDAIRFKKDEEDIRTPFFRDIDRIIHSLSYTRYADKTQVFSYKENDHISKRITHVQLVSKIARTIGRALRLNEDLIEAIALSHDIGHTPLGHTGEAILNDISKRELNEYFAHNIQGVRQVMYVDNNGMGLNLNVQVLDGIFTHNGEMLSEEYVPEKKSKEEFLREYEESYKDIKKSKTYHPMTLEGCVVRISDIIGYIGRDIEDAINIKVFDRDDIPKDIADVLGTTNKDIVNTIVLDIINESIDKPYIKMSKKVYNALFKLKEFNYKEIYVKAITGEEFEYYKNGMNMLYEKYLNQLNDNDTDSMIYKVFIKNQSNEYNEKTSNKRKVIDFISGMTDEFFIKEIEQIS